MGDGGKEMTRMLNTGIKETPVRTWTGPESFRRLRLPDFKTIGK
jgi:hypothetical protein